MDKQKIIKKADQVIAWAQGLAEEAAELKRLLQKDDIVSATHTLKINPKVIAKGLANRRAKMMGK